MWGALSQGTSAWKTDWYISVKPRSC
jgi:hypothetical protein